MTSPAERDDAVLGVLPRAWLPVAQAAGPGEPAVVRVVGGAGGTAALVADVAELGERLGRLAEEARPAETAALLVAAAADAESLVLLAPPGALVAGDCLATAATVAGTAAALDALAGAVRVAAEAYAGVEAAQTRTWHLATATLLPHTLTLLVAAAVAHEGLQTPGSAPLETALLEAALDGGAARLVADPRIGSLVDCVEAATGRGPADGQTVTTVEESDLQRVTAALGAAYRPSAATLTRLDRAPAGAVEAPPGEGLAGLVQGVADASPADEHVVAVRDRVVDGRDGRRVVRVVDLPGTDTWTPPGRPRIPTDLGSGLRQLGGAADEAYVEAVLQLVRTAPPGATVVLVGHSLGGLTAATVAAVAAARGLRVHHVVTAGSPVDTTVVPRGTTVLALANDADPVPALDGRPARDVAGRTTVVVDDDAGRLAAGHAIGGYVAAARAADRLARTDPGLGATVARMGRDGALIEPGDRVQETVTWWRVGARPVERPSSTGPPHADPGRRRPRPDGRPGRGPRDGVSDGT